MNATAYKTTNTIKPTATVKTDLFVNAKFPSLNKNDFFEDYKSQLDETLVTKVLMQEIVILTNEDFEEFKYSLLNDQEWLSGKGGNDSDYKVSDDLGLGRDLIWFDLTIEQQRLWIAQSYRLVIMVYNQNGEHILVDPQGYNYARYCGVMVK